MTEGFPPHYQQLLERYYRRLAEEKPAGEASDEAPVSKESAGLITPNAALARKLAPVAMEKSSAPVAKKASTEQATP
jgi:hypothetical protein